jgi:hypothetical protein
VVGYWKCCGPSAPLGRAAAHKPQRTCRAIARERQGYTFREQHNSARPGNLEKFCARRDSRFNSTAVAENFRIDSVLVATRLEAKAGMHDNLNIDQVFPIQDDVSAWLMCVKAELLHDAGIINAKELNVVIERATTKSGLYLWGRPQPKKKDPWLK